jgi:thymidylate kinase
MIYILEGPDGVGKTTLAQEIYAQTKGHILHCTWKKEWTMKQYFVDIMKSAKELNKYQDVIIDRWAPSESVYGRVYREGPQFDVFDFLWENDALISGCKWIICENENVVENHKKNMTERKEMFDDAEKMGKIAEEFADFVDDTKQLNWIHYDFNKVDMKEFVKELVGENVSH